MRPPLITLTTDFGTADGYVAQMKGVLRRLVPEAVVDDLAHDLPPHDVIAGALFLDAAVPRYPESSVHIVVVDPGVGTARRPIVAEWRNRFIVGPDNGLITLLLERHPAATVHEIRLPCVLPGVPECLSATFHGRDLFAPVAAYLARGGQPDRLGPPVADPVRLAFPVPTGLEGGGLAGEVIHVDRFGNAITNLDRQAMDNVFRGQTVEVVVESPGTGPVRARVVITYGEAAPGELIALINSGGRLELAVPSGHAARLWNLAPGTRVTVTATAG